MSSRFRKHLSSASSRRVGRSVLTRCTGISAGEFAEVRGCSCFVMSRHPDQLSGVSALVLPTIRRPRLWRPLALRPGLSQRLAPCRVNKLRRLLTGVPDPQFARLASRAHDDRVVPAFGADWLEERLLVVAVRAPDLRGEVKALGHEPDALESVCPW